MAFEKFIPAVESAKLLEARDVELCLAAHCTRKYEGEITKAGDRIKIVGIGSPTVYTLQKDGTYIANAVGAGSVAGKGKDVIHKGIPDPEEVEDYEIELPINQIAVFNYLVGDIDKELMNDNGKVASLRKKAAKKIAEEQEKYVAQVMCTPTELQYKGQTDYSRSNVFYVTSGNNDSTNSTEYVNVLKLIDSMVVKLNEQNVSDSEQLVLECTPAFWSILKEAYRDLDTDNSAMLAGRKCGKYNDILIFKSNNVKVSNVEYIFLRTLEAVAFVDPLTHTEAYRPDKGFSDGVKGFDLYDAAVVDPKAILYAKVVA